MDMLNFLFQVYTEQLKAWTPRVLFLASSRDNYLVTDTKVESDPTSILTMRHALS